MSQTFTVIRGDRVDQAAAGQWGWIASFTEFNTPLNTWKAHCVNILISWPGGMLHAFYTALPSQDC